MTENDSENLIFQITEADANARLDSFLTEKIAAWSRSRLQKLIDDGDVWVNGKAVKSSYKLRLSDEIEVELVSPPNENFEPENIALDIVYEDEELAVINKPAGMVVHPGAGVTSGTLANAIAFHFKIRNPQSAIRNRVGIVHRLDKDTSGLIVVAKDGLTHEILSEQFKKREVFKSYLALVHGAMKEPSGKIDAPIGRDRRNRLRMTVSKTGRNALSFWHVRERFERFTLLEVEIKTGRTHQIRVHLAHVKHPIVGDELYNGGRDKNVTDVQLKAEIARLNRFFLHAEKLAFNHPKTNDRMRFHTPLPLELNSFLTFLRKSNEI